MTTMQGLDDLIAAGRVSAAEADACRAFAADRRVAEARIEMEAGHVAIWYRDTAGGAYALSGTDWSVCDVIRAHRTYLDRRIPR